MARKRDYPQEYQTYHAKPEQKKKRAMRNAARRELIAEGRVAKGDGKDVGHKVPLRKGGGNAEKNLAVQTKRFNRGWSGGGKNR
jgi:5-methylcytosine-specific restriction endonuclease McrA